jgi:1-acyl-sn-glycerol-3-phosphate acyltransferase
VAPLRATLRALLLIALSVLVAAPGLLVSLLRLSGARGDRLALRCVLVLQRLWCRGALAILRVRVRAEGAPPREAMLLVSNHLSYVDVAVLGSARTMRFVSKAEVARWPGFGWLARLARVIFLRRGARRDLQRVGEQIRASLAAGVPVVVFPEGTSTPGLDVRTFHAGLLQPAAQLGLPCLPVTLRYETPAGQPAPSECVCWWGDMTFPPHLWRLMTLTGVVAEVIWGQQPVRAADRKALAAELQHRVAARFVPVRQDTSASAAASQGEPARIAALR